METLLTEKLLTIAGEIQKEKATVLSSLNITQGHDKFLLCLLSQDGMTMGSISQLIDTKAPSTAKFAAKLEEQGFIRRESSALDSRQQHAFLTDAGKSVAGELEEQYRNIDKALKDKLSQKKQDRLMLLLQKLKADEKGKRPAALKPKKAGKSAKQATKSKEKKRKKKKEK